MTDKKSILLKLSTRKNEGKVSPRIDFGRFTFSFTGQTWKDLTGFHLNVSGKSSKGFPDVAVYSFLVMPHNTDIMWAGTDIGLVESTDGAESWHIVNSNFPNASTWDMKVKDQGQIVLATHGRGIWTATLDDLKDFVPNPVTLPPVLNSVYQVDVDDKYLLTSNVFIKSKI